MVTFEEHVRRAIDSLPDDLREAMSNVAILVEDENPEDPDLYGLYTGVALTERTSDYSAASPTRSRSTAGRSRRTSVTTPRSSSTRSA